MYANVTMCHANSPSCEVFPHCSSSDMLRQFMNHNEFEFDRVFDENADNASVYACTAESLVDITLQGGFSTCMVYGQTGQVTAVHD